MNRTFRVIAAALVLGLSQHEARAAGEETGGRPGAWLMNYSGARTLGLGGAFTATADDALGALWNPAGLQRMDQNQIMFENVPLYENGAINSVSFAMPGNWLPSFGVTMVSLKSRDFQRTDEMNNDLGSFGEGETAYLLTLAKGLSPRLAIGANFKVVQQSVEDFSAGGFGADVGALFQVAPSLRLGATVKNLGGPSITLRDVPEDYPVSFRGGAALSLFNGRGLVSAELDRQGDSPMALHAGAEFWIQNSVGFQVGMQDSRATGGFSYRFMPQYEVDYAVADHPLGLTHRIGVSYRFGGFFASSRALPEVFSPMGEKPTTQIGLNARTKSQAERWTLEVVDKTHQVVRRFGGPGLPPPHVQWDGKDENGLPVADGTYTYRLTVTDHDGRPLDAPLRRVTITTGGPQGDVPVSTQQ
jgi:hypothetical protein